MMFSKNIFSSRLKEARNGLTQTQAAEKVGLSQQGWARYELGKVMPGAEAIHQICSSFGVSADWLLGLSELKSTAVDFSAQPTVNAPNNGGAIAIGGDNAVSRDCLECPLLKDHLKRFSKPR